MHRPASYTVLELTHFAEFIKTEADTAYNRRHDEPVPPVAAGFLGER
jgi:hypothetical protein